MKPAQIMTEFVYPPIPVRCFDWVAWFDGREEWLQGRGKTEDEAIQDLLDEQEAAQ